MSAEDKVNILLVDDNNAKLLSHEAILEEIGETLIKASSARKAFEVLLRHEVAVILIDVCMPELDGFELARMIREHPRFRTTSIIFVSAVMMTKPDQLRGYQLGGVDYVPVPVVPELLRAKVKVFVDLYRKTRELERFNAELEQRVGLRTAELRRLNEELEQRIEQRTREREIALAQLFEAQKLDTIGQLTGGVAHDFNNLLMAVLGSLAPLEQRLAPDDHYGRRLLQNAVQGAQRGASLTQRLLAFSRRQELKPQSVRIADLMQGMDELLKRALGHDIELQLEFPADLPPLHVDPNQLELALLNLALNARDATPGSGRLTVSAAAYTQAFEAPGMALRPGDYVLITISDTGIGMDEATLAKATEPFFTTKGPGKGTGLGLSMVHGLAAQSGGLLRIRSELLVGTTVQLWLPRGGTSAASLARPDPGPAVLPLTQHCTVLIVDDDPLVMTSTAAIIEDLGHTPIEAQSGAEALNKVASGVGVDVVLTDHAMPGMTGVQLAARVREQFPELPIILASGYAELPDDPTAVELIKLTKPYTRQQIAAAIHRAVRRRPAATGALADTGTAGS